MAHETKRRLQSVGLLKMACTECHAAKVKCDKNLPCARCIRLSRVCVRHESQQGRRKRTTSSDGNNNNRQRKKNNEATKAPQDGLLPSEDGALTTELDCSTLKPDNYGLNYLVRSWISLAFTRRSFSLLSRATSIAARCGVPMDQILCEHQRQRGMDFLYPILLTPSTEQKVLGEPLRYSELPLNVLSAMGLPEPNGENNNQDLTCMGNRWIWFRETKKGISRFLCSPAFERDIVSTPLIEATYEANKIAVVDLFLDEKDRAKQIRGFAQQVLSVHAVKDVSPKLTRLSCIQLKCNFCPTPIEVDQINCMSIPNLDHSFLAWEYVRRNKKPAASPEKQPSSQPVETTTLSNTIEAPTFDSDDMLDVDDLDDKDLELILEYLG